MHIAPNVFEIKVIYYVFILFLHNLLISVLPFILSSFSFTTVLKSPRMMNVFLDSCLCSLLMSYILFYRRHLVRKCLLVLFPCPLLEVLVLAFYHL